MQGKGSFKILWKMKKLRSVPVSYICISIDGTESRTIVRWKVGFVVRKVVRPMDGTLCKFRYACLESGGMHFRWHSNNISYPSRLCFIRKRSYHCQRLWILKPPSRKDDQVVDISFHLSSSLSSRKMVKAAHRDRERGYERSVKPEW